MQKRLSVLLVIFLVGLVSLSNLQAQDKGMDEVTSTYFLPNVNVTVKPGMTLENVSIVIENGIIKEVGPNISAPFNAEIIKADSLHVYSAFIDALSHTGVAKKEDEKSKEKIIPGLATNQQAGITPEVSLMDVIDASDKSIENMRKNGFAISHAVPRGKMMPGQGSIISLSGKGKESIFLKENISVYSQFSAARRMYPSTIIGMMAKWRDMYRQASYGIKHESAYKTNPLNTKRPAFNDATRGLYDVVQNKKPVFFNTSDHLTASRAMALEKELGFNLILSELKQGNKLIPKIKSKSANVLLSIELPKEEKEDKKKKKDDDKDSKKEKKKEITPDDKEKEALKERKKKAVLEYVGQAAEFEKNGIQFSFSFLSSKPKDLLPNLKRMREAGLSDDAALAALTTNPAKLLGISNVSGSVERGKMANLIVTTKPLFEEKSKIKFVFVEGNKFEYKAKEDKKKEKKDGDAADVNVAGTWSYEIEIPGVVPTGKLIIEKNDDDLKITMTSDQDPDDDPEIIDDAEMDGSNMTFSFEADNDGFKMNVDVDVDFDGESYEGTVSVGDFGSFPISGDLIDKPEN